MPIYEYVCTNCGERTEVMHAVHAAGPIECSTCGGPLRKALSLPAIVFKGSGWAKKDARSGTYSSSKDETAKTNGSLSPESGGATVTKEATGAKDD